MKFYTSYYSSDKMTLVIMGNYDMEKLEEWAVSKFSEVPIGLDLVPVRENVNAFPTEKLSKFVWYKPIGT